MLLEAAHDDSRKSRGNLRPMLGDWCRLRCDVSGKSLLRIEAGERRSAGEKLVTHYAESVDICARVDERIRSGLLGRHVGGSTERDAE